MDYVFKYAGDLKKAVMIEENTEQWNEEIGWMHQQYQMWSETENCLDKTRSKPDSIVKSCMIIYKRKPQFRRPGARSESKWARIMAIVRDKIQPYI